MPANKSAESGFPGEIMIPSQPAWSMKTSSVKVPPDSAPLCVCVLVCVCVF